MLLICVNSSTVYIHHYKELGKAHRIFAIFSVDVWNLWIPCLSKIYSQSPWPWHCVCFITNLFLSSCFFQHIVYPPECRLGWLAEHGLLFDNMSNRVTLMHFCPHQARLQALVFFSWQISERGSKQLHKTLPLWQPTLFRAGILQANLANYTQVWC